MGSSDTYFVIVTRGHRYDQVCLEKITQKEHAYIGMIGSRRRVALVKRLLVENGCDQEVLDEVYTPIGLDIGA
ncbi:MAG: XdhC family protein [Dorea sp.]